MQSDKVHIILPETLALLAFFAPSRHQVTSRGANAYDHTGARSRNRDF